MAEIRSQTSGARIGPAVEEIVRYASPVIWMRRTLIRDASLNGLGFGAAGPHFCLGAHLAREITTMLRELLTRLPDIRAAGEPDYLRSSMINGIKHLPGEFD